MLERKKIKSQSPRVTEFNSEIYVEELMFLIKSMFAWKC